MKNDSQSGVASLKAPSMRGLSASPERRRNNSSASSRPSRPKYFCSRATMAQRWRPSSALSVKRVRKSEMEASLDIALEQVTQSGGRGRGLAEMTLLLDRSRLGVALDHDQAAQHG